MADGSNHHSRGRIDAILIGSLVMRNYVWDLFGSDLVPNISGLVSDPSVLAGQGATGYYSSWTRRIPAKGALRQSMRNLEAVRANVLDKIMNIIRKGRNSYHYGYEYEYDQPVQIEDEAVGSLVRRGRGRLCRTRR